MAPLHRWPPPARRPASPSLPRRPREYRRRPGAARSHASGCHRTRRPTALAPSPRPRARGRGDRETCPETGSGRWRATSQMSPAREEPCSSSSPDSKAPAATTRRPPAKSRVGTKAFVKGTRSVSPTDGAMAKRSPAPKFSTAATWPSAWPASSSASNPTRSDLIELVLIGRRQAGTVDVELGPGQGGGTVAVGQAFDPRHQHIVLERPERRKGEGSLPVLGPQGPIGPRSQVATAV